jgi:hypothetical protein
MIDGKPPKIENAPGLVWRPRQGDWCAYWIARSDLFQRGWKPGVVPMWKGGPLNEFEIKRIQTECQQLQADMLIWGRGGVPADQSMVFDGTLHGLVDRYERDEFSNFPKLQFATRRSYKILMTVLVKERGSEMLTAIRGPILMKWHEGWTQNRGPSMAKQLLRMLRVLLSFGFTILEDKECERLCNVMGKMRFKSPPRRTAWLVAEQATALRAHAHTTKYKSMALAQAIQFDCLLRQKDVIGEWVPVNEPGMSAVVSGGRKWMKGIRWEEIDDSLVLRHVTSKRGKPLEVPLRLCPMVMEELALIAGTEAVERHMLPKAGPVIKMDTTGEPWRTFEYRTRWRKLAEAVGIPKHVFNMDSRAGGITEASDAGAPLEHIRHAATHSDIQTTQGYSRGAADKTANVLEMRALHRKNAKRTP